jgi:hypothetical protein
MLLGQAILRIDQFSHTYVGFDTLSCPVPIATTLLSNGWSARGNGWCPAFILLARILNETLPYSTSSYRRTAERPRGPAVGGVALAAETRCSKRRYPAHHEA